jgi:hypothetical protein
VRPQGAPQATFTPIAPRVLAATEHLLLLAWVGPGERARDFDEPLGRGLAALPPYPLLVHVCLFGASYVSQLSRAARHYA